MHEHAHVAARDLENVAVQQEVAHLGMGNPLPLGPELRTGARQMQS